MHGLRPLIQQHLQPLCGTHDFRTFGVEEGCDLRLTADWDSFARQFPTGWQSDFVAL